MVLGSIADILSTLGVDATRVFADWDTDQKAIAAWITEGSLSTVILECHQPNGTVSPIFEFPVAYGLTGEGDRKFTADRAALARYLAKPEDSTDWHGPSDFLFFQRGSHGTARLGRWQQSLCRRDALLQFWDACCRATCKHRATLLQQVRHGMGYIDDAFDGLKRQLEITDTELRLASSRHTLIREHIEKTWDLEDHFLTGSYDRHTKTKRLKDVDIFIVIDPKGRKAVC